MGLAIGDADADAGIRSVDLTRERVVLRRELRGMKMAIGLPVSSFLGIALRIEPPAGDAVGAIEIVLAHREPALSIALYRGSDTCDVIADWQAWSNVLGLPLLLAERDGGLREAFRRIGALRVGCPARRRRRRFAINKRRPAIPLRRKPGRQSGAASRRGSMRGVIATN
jgi:hypothetical protein